MATFLTDNDVKQAVADELSTSVSELASSWTNNASYAHQIAVAEMYSTLLSRGYTPAQIAAWDDGAAFERNLSLYYCFSRPQGQGSYDDRPVAKFDCRAALKTVLLRINGAWITPGDTPGTIGFGAVSTSGDIFTGPWAGDEDGDRPTRW